ncbi:MAG TPA: preprotein translocase subunit SecG [Spirochaetota bacterium]|nr:preprotein translocase subunit SecG [Spirochaetota bacterium]HOS33830.1 preprotein translocase subunit SecG [Spirochaetota bacterium]HOS56237.1 preprotein translocase subunit SecG [Spirochaetota bacterium]HPK62447.1 preprotein translocase subunit SecG [Spirochaetota bacterium]HQF78644.1 preprotein translocase subunit SecG [Spirochaetota bacterium]
MGTALIIIFTVVMFIVCFLIVSSVMLQEDKAGGGMGIIGGSSQSFFGASSGTLLSKITSVLLTIFFVLSIVLALISSSFTKGSVISEMDIYESETSEYEAPVRKMLKDLPAKIQTDDFDKNVLGKITDEEIKATITSFYTLDKTEKYYELKSKLNKEDTKKVLKILNDVGFSMEAVKTEFGPTESDEASD